MSDERSEKEHKDLIKTANDGMGAIKKLHEKYTDVTRIRYDKSGIGDDFEEIIQPDGTDWFHFEEK